MQKAAIYAAFLMLKIYIIFKVLCSSFCSISDRVANDVFEPKYDVMSNSSNTA